jgi:hypothetical protein
MGKHDVQRRVTLEQATDDAALGRDRGFEREPDDVTKIVTFEATNIAGVLRIPRSGFRIGGVARGRKRSVLSTFYSEALDHAKQSGCVSLKGTCRHYSRALKVMAVMKGLGLHYVMPIFDSSVLRVRRE